jgi:hypothetical protein
MAKKMRFKLNPDEKKRLRQQKIKIASLEDFSINELAKLLDVPVARAREIVYGAIDTSPLFPIYTNSLQDIAAAFNPLKSLGPIAAILATQHRIDESLSPFQSLGTSLARELAQTKNAFTSTGMASMLAQINQDSSIIGSTSKLFANSILASEAYHKLGVHDITKNLVLGGWNAKPNILTITTQIAGMNEITNNRLGSFEWAALGSRLQLENQAVFATQKHFLSFSAGYANVLRTIGKMPDWAQSYPVLIKMPTIEFGAHGTALEVISTEDEEEANSAQLSQEITIETSSGIELYLPRLHTGFPKMWTGALQALQSTNVDRIRHFNVSVRELFMHVMQALAPDEKNFANGRPTRKSRLIFICRNLQGGDYEKFLIKDIAAMLELIDLFQQGTHGIEPDFTEIQLRALKFRVESALRFLLEIEFTTNRT